MNRRDELKQALRDVKSPQWWDQASRATVGRVHDLAIDSQSTNMSLRLMFALDRGCERRYGVKAVDYRYGTAPYKRTATNDTRTRLSDQLHRRVETIKKAQGSEREPARSAARDRAPQQENNGRNR